MMEPAPVRCAWCGIDPLYRDYHDREWGVPSRDERHLFEMLILEGAQAGLSWIVILRKREGYRRAFADFDLESIAAFDDSDVARMLTNPGIVRNRLKIAAAIHNARQVLELQARGTRLSDVLWDFVDGEPRQNAWTSLSEIPAKTPESERMSKALKRLGFRFVGSTICYALMQSVGMVNDHLTGCFRYREVQGLI